MVTGKIDRPAVAISVEMPLEEIALINICYSTTTCADFEAVTMELNLLMENFEAASEKEK